MVNVTVVTTTAVAGPAFATDRSAAGVTGVVTARMNDAIGPDGPSGSMTAVLTIDAVCVGLTRAWKLRTATSEGATTPGGDPGPFTSAPTTTGEVPPASA